MNKNTIETASCVDMDSLVYKNDLEASNKKQTAPNHD